MLNIFPVFTGKLLQTVQNSSFHKTCYLEAKKERFAQFCNCTVILLFLNFGHENVFAVFTGKLLETLQNTSVHKTFYSEAKTNVLHNFAMAL